MWLFLGKNYGAIILKEYYFLIKIFGCNLCVFYTQNKIDLLIFAIFLFFFVIFLTFFSIFFETSRQFSITSQQNWQILKTS